MNSTGNQTPGYLSPTTSTQRPEARRPQLNDLNPASLTWQLQPGAWIPTTSDQQLWPSVQRPGEHISATKDQAISAHQPQPRVQRQSDLNSVSRDLVHCVFYTELLNMNLCTPRTGHSRKTSETEPLTPGSNRLQGLGSALLHTSLPGRSRVRQKQKVRGICVYGLI